MYAIERLFFCNSWSRVTNCASQMCLIGASENIIRLWCNGLYFTFYLVDQVHEELMCIMLLGTSVLVKFEVNFSLQAYWGDTFELSRLKNPYYEF